MNPWELKFQTVSGVFLLRQRLLATDVGLFKMADNFVKTGKLFGQVAGYGDIVFQGNIDGDNNYFGINTENPGYDFHKAGTGRIDTLLISPPTSEPVSKANGQMWYHQAPVQRRIR